jgi:hypothetical protein
MVRARRAGPCELPFASALTSKSLLGVCACRSIRHATIDRLPQRDRRYGAAVGGLAVPTISARPTRTTSGTLVIQRRSLGLLMGDPLPAAQRTKTARSNDRRAMLILAS